MTGQSRLLMCGIIEEMVAGRTDWRSKSTRQGYEAMMVQLKGCADLVGLGSCTGGELLEAAFQ